MSEPALPATTRNPLLWGAYLACSWTWCIGMYLPILLLRDMGWPGFLIFAVPNVIGAAAMGWVVKSRFSSARFVEKHTRAIWWFSAATLAFHLYWILWIAGMLEAALQIPDGFLYMGLAFFLVLSWILSRFFGRGKSLLIAAVLFAFSLMVFFGTFSSAALQEANFALISSSPKLMDVRWMCPVMIFGFLLCPYLDITFHHARQQLDTVKNSRLGFTIGFVGFFSFMILLTTQYAGAMDAEALSPWLAAGILLHIFGQAFFTICVHLNRMRALPVANGKSPLLLTLLVISAIIGFLAPWLPAYNGLSGGEIIYRLFMSAYGLIFPTYILYRVITQNKSARGYSYMWTIIGLATPFFWMGFIEGQTVWLVPGIALVIVGSLVRKAKPHAA